MILNINNHWSITLITNQYQEILFTKLLLCILLKPLSFLFHVAKFTINFRSISSKSSFKSRVRFNINSGLFSCIESLIIVHFLIFNEIAHNYCSTSANASCAYHKHSFTFWYRLMYKLMWFLKKGYDFKVWHIINIQD